MVSIRAVKEPVELTGLSDGSDPEPELPPREWFQSDSVSLVASSDAGRAAGAVLLVPDRRVAEKIRSFKLAWLYVAQARRRQGVARALLKAASRFAAQMGAKCIHVSLSPRNETAIALFDNLGRTEGATFVVHLTHGGF